MPTETPLKDEVFLVLLPFYDWSELERIPMERNGDGTWSATAMVAQGGLVRYVYD
ncbi:MAG: hypothetical protein HYX99_03410, partial [Chloroflexi bacterium]|nr:hypothetical protein [Chloroflexota bacterium]